ncbi:MAG: flagellar hook-basal body complex protein FliE [Selenomonadaceae bacterium]|nr:flagellar hook-basal body complex protein FliE [Selenomonadaceae bacterium]MBQ1914737.1 flagellar hook-basal body complex protein FliE [Selenomonadaceae bacterium]
MQMEPLQMTPVRQVAMSAESHLGETEDKQVVKSFGEYLVDSLKKTNELILDSDKWNAALAAGKVEDISQVVVAGQKAELALQLTLQLRNKATSAYQEIMRMQV